MPESAGQERTEKATGKRRREARSKGQVAQSREIPSVLILATALGFFYFAGSWMFWNLSEFFVGIYHDLDVLRFNEIADVSAFSVSVSKKAFTILIPFFLAVLIAGIVGNVYQVGFEFHLEPMSPKFSKLNPITGTKKFFSLKALMELGKSLVKVLFVGGIAYGLIRSEMTAFPSLMQQEVGQILLFICKVAFKIFFYVGLAMVVLAILDYIYQRWQHEQNLKMTKQEVKDERKQSDGDPKIKARIRRVQMEIAQRRMMEAVPQADVVITNPTHLAIALRFDAQEMIAPCVVAKGAGYIAERIKDIAREHDVPIVEDKPLARTLYKMVDIGDYIPVQLYRAVAEILAYVYRLKGMQNIA